jgi:hypothetical protein
MRRTVVVVILLVLWPCAVINYDDVSIEIPISMMLLILCFLKVHDYVNSLLNLKKKLLFRNGGAGTPDSSLNGHTYMPEGLKFMHGRYTSNSTKKIPKMMKLTTTIALSLFIIDDDQLDKILHT